MTYEPIISREVWVIGLHALFVVMFLFAAFCFLVWAWDAVRTYVREAPLRKRARALRALQREYRHERANARVYDWEREHALRAFGGVKSHAFHDHS